MAQDEAVTNEDAPRDVAVLLRVSREDRMVLRERAAAEGTTVQGYLERVLFGYAGDPRLPGRKPQPDHHQEQLPMTG